MLHEAVEERKVLVTMTAQRLPEVDGSSPEPCLFRIGTFVFVSMGSVLSPCAR
jgi:hypothetical protein